jgi:predicted transcriptional regulator
MSTYTSSLTDDIFQQLGHMAKALKLAKSKLLEKALRVYSDLLNRAEYTSL